MPRQAAGVGDMEIKWANVFGFALLIFAFVLVIRMHERVHAFLASMGQMGPEHTTDEKIWGLIAFGLVAITLAGLIQILIRSQDRR